MKKLKLNIVLIALLGCLGTSYTLQASDLNIPNQFTSGTPAVAAEVNANFDAVATSVNDNQSQLTLILARLDALETENAALQASIASLQNDQVAGLANYLSIDTNLDRVVFSGANVHINNGLGGSTSINAVGNLVVGYDETTGSSRLMCSDGQLNNQTDCEAAGEIWDTVHKTGSHNLVIGPGHNYSRSGGLLAGALNSVLAHNASVSGGSFNTSSGPSSSVSGGAVNTSSGLDSSVSGGFNNTASGEDSSVSGGIDNLASGSVSSVSGGSANSASGGASSVSGGGGGEAPGDFDWVAGTLFEDS